MNGDLILTNTHTHTDLTCSIFVLISLSKFIYAFVQNDAIGADKRITLSINQLFLNNNNNNNNLR